MFSVDVLTLLLQRYFAVNHHGLGYVAPFVTDTVAAPAFCFFFLP